jgi:hypothetical protein
MTKINNSEFNTKPHFFGLTRKKKLIEANDQSPHNLYNNKKPN